MAVSAAQLAAFQAATNRTMDQTCTIQREVQTPDGAGGHSSTWPAIATVACHVNQPTPQLLQNYDYLIGSQSAWLVRVPVGTNVREGDRLIVGGQTLKVQVILAPRSYPIALRLLAAEVQ